MKGHPYKINEMSYDDFLDFKPLVTARNWKTASDNSTVKWNKVREVSVQYKKPSAGSIDHLTSKTNKRKN